MINFKIAEPQTIDQVTSLLSEKKEKYYLMAGGTDLLGEIKDEIIEPEVVMDLKSIPNLSYIKKEREGVRIGVLTTVAELADNPLIKQDYPGLHEAALSVATPQLRNVGTIGGNLCQRPRCWYYRDAQVVCRKKGGSRCYATRGKNKYHAIFGGGVCHIVHPSDLAPALISLDSEISISTPKGDKTVSLADFYTLPRENVRKENILNPGEVVREIKIPLAKSGEKSTYYKIKERGGWDFAIASAAVKGTVSGGGFKDIKIVLGGVAPVPWRLEKAEKQVKGKKASEKLLKQAAREALKDARAMTENGYKKELVEAVIYRAAMSLG
ncbi:MAG: xanthine dehydrogenase family protein subunit M [Candidatus Aminicenantes bacterium]|nr:MAG: xanthine dehydrogenase family protein subunit M [Candidatus Aminicenantes bacterium]